MPRSRKILLVLLPAFSLFFQCAAGLGDTDDRLPEAEPDATVVSPTPGESALEVEMVPIDVKNPLIILDALIRSYPGKIDDLALRDGDWSVLVNGQLIYWADGRMLNAQQREQTDSYRRYSFSPNPPQAPPVRVLTDEEKAKLDSYITGRERKKDFRSEAFLNALWGMEGYWDSESTVIIREFLGTRIRIHPDIEQALMIVESSIIDAAENDPAVATWYSSVGSVGGYVWRNIAGSANRSLHSFGIAIDVQPRSFQGKHAYWRWTADLQNDWWAVPHTERYQIPEAVIAAFESQGFFWGGKWFLYDQIHFEYRPEIILLGNWADGSSL